MSIIIKFPAESEDVFIRASLIMTEHKQGLAIDALRHLLSVISSLTIQLEDYLTNFWINKDSEYARIKSPLIADLVWSIIDRTRQIVRIIPFINVVVNESDKPLLARIKDFRDSYHHVDERIDDYFVNNGHSVFGHISWRERKSVDVKRERQTIMRTGVLRGMSQFSPEIIRDHIEEYRYLTGIFDVNFYYVRKFTSGTGKNKVTHHEQLGIRVDDIADLINRIVPAFTTQIAAVLLESAMRNNVVVDKLPHHGFFPRTMSLQFGDDEVSNEKTPPIS